MPAKVWISVNRGESPGNPCATVHVKYKANSPQWSSWKKPDNDACTGCNVQTCGKDDDGACSNQADCEAEAGGVWTPPTTCAPGTYHKVCPCFADRYDWDSDCEAPYYIEFSEADIGWVELQAKATIPNMVQSPLSEHKFRATASQSRIDLDEFDMVVEGSVWEGNGAWEELAPNAEVETGVEIFLETELSDATLEFSVGIRGTVAEWIKLDDTDKYERCPCDGSEAYTEPQLNAESKSWGCVCNRLAGDLKIAARVHKPGMLSSGIKRFPIKAHRETRDSLDEGDYPPAGFVYVKTYVEYDVPAELMLELNVSKEKYAAAMLKALEDKAPDLEREVVRVDVTPEGIGFTFTLASNDSTTNDISKALSNEYIKYKIGMAFFDRELIAYSQIPTIYMDADESYILYQKEEPGLSKKDAATIGGALLAFFLVCGGCILVCACVARNEHNKQRKKLEIERQITENLMREQEAQKKELEAMEASIRMQEAEIQRREEELAQSQQRLASERAELDRLREEADNAQDEGTKQALLAKLKEKEEAVQTVEKQAEELKAKYDAEQSQRQAELDLERERHREAMARRRRQKQRKKQMENGGKKRASAEGIKDSYDKEQAHLDAHVDLERENQRRKLEERRRKKARKKQQNGTKVVPFAAPADVEEGSPVVWTDVPQGGGYA
jgi:hypothetical protein